MGGGYLTPQGQYLPPTLISGGPRGGGGYAQVPLLPPPLPPPPASGNSYLLPGPAQGGGYVEQLGRPSGAGRGQVGPHIKYPRECESVGSDSEAIFWADRHKKSPLFPKITSCLTY